MHDYHWILPQRYSRKSIENHDLHYRLPTKLRGGNVFSLSVCHSVNNVTITHDYSCNLTGQGPPAPALHPLLMTSGGHHWRSVQTCSLQDSLLVLTSGGYWGTYGQSKWEASILLKWFLLSMMSFNLHSQDQWVAFKWKLRSKQCYKRFFDIFRYNWDIFNPIISGLSFYFRANETFNFFANNQLHTLNIRYQPTTYFLIFSNHTYQEIWKFLSFLIYQWILVIE